MISSSLRGFLVVYLVCWCKFIKAAFITAFSLYFITVREHDLHDVNFFEYIDASLVAWHMVSLISVLFVLEEDVYFLVIEDKFLCIMFLFNKHYENH